MLSEVYQSTELIFRQQCLNTVFNSRLFVERFLRCKAALQEIKFLQ